MKKTLTIVALLSTTTFANPAYQAGYNILTNPTVVNATKTVLQVAGATAVTVSVSESTQALRDNYTHTAVPFSPTDTEKERIDSEVKDSSLTKEEFEYCVSDTYTRYETSPNVQRWRTVLDASISACVNYQDPAGTWSKSVDGYLFFVFENTIAVRGGTYLKWYKGHDGLYNVKFAGVRFFFNEYKNVIKVTTGMPEGVLLSPRQIAQFINR